VVRHRHCAYVHKYMYIYTYTYMCICIHTCIHQIATLKARLDQEQAERRGETKALSEAPAREKDIQDALIQAEKALRNKDVEVRV
jgi:hypothetical protein